MKKVLKNGLFIIVSIFFSLLGFSIVWCLGTWRRLSIDELIYELSAPLKGTGSDMIAQFILKCLVPTVMVLAVAVFFGYIRKNKVIVNGWLLLSVVFAVTSAVVLCVKLNVYEYIVNMGDDSSFIEDYYVDSGDVKITFPDEKRNLIYIFLESMEMTYSDTENGGAFEQDMIPELTELAEENECFSGDDKLNGAYVTYGTTWTIGGMFAQTSGLPLKILVEENSMDEESAFFPGASCLGDILAEQGYNQELLIGSDAVFGGRELYFGEHGNYTMHDYNYALENHIIPKDYMVFWGYEDTKLFENAKRDLLELSKKDEPFNLTMLTVDTHFPDGYVCDACEDKFNGNQYANVIACSSGQVIDFVHWIQKQDFYDNTTVVICGDHTTMNVTLCEDVSDDYDRKVYTTIINSAANKKKKGERQYATIDMFPTTLAALGADIEGNRLGLGTNLYSDRKTLVEEFGFSEVETQFKKNSLFMDSLSGMVDEDMKKKKGWLPDAEVKVSEYDEEDGTLTLEADNITNVAKVKKVIANLYDSDSNKIGSYKMEQNDDRSYTCQIDMNSLEGVVDSIDIDAVGKETATVGELSGDLSIQAHDSLGDYITKLQQKDNIAILMAGCGDFTSIALDRELDELKRLGIDEHLKGNSFVSFYAAVDLPSIVYGSGEDPTSFEGELMGNNLPYKIESVGGEEGGSCSIVIDGEEYALNERGINIVVYDYDLGKVIDSVVFDLFANGYNFSASDMNVSFSDDRMTVTLVDLSKNKLWKCKGLLWDKKHRKKPIELDFHTTNDFLFTADVSVKNIDIEDAYIEITGNDNTHTSHKYIDWHGNLNYLKGSLIDYLTYVKENMDDKIILISSKDDMGLADDEDIKEALGIWGLSKFSYVSEHEGYYAVITPEGVVEKYGKEELVCEDEYKGSKYTIRSAGWDAGFYSSILLNGEECSRGEGGLNIVVYDTKENRIDDITTYRYVNNGGDHRTFMR